jgi:crossover junction endodeoxyribonuclease RuvC
MTDDVQNVLFRTPTSGAVRYRGPPAVTRILGIDPGSQRTGVGVIDVDATGRCTFVPAEALVLLDAANFPRAWACCAKGLETLIDSWRPRMKSPSKPSSWTRTRPGRLSWGTRAVAGAGHVVRRHLACTNTPRA